eukprot:scaffold205204_cov71-Attheya_sp.AAC.1
MAAVIRVVELEGYHARKQHDTSNDKYDIRNKYVAGSLGHDDDNHNDPYRVPVPRYRVPGTSLNANKAH